MKNFADLGGCYPPRPLTLVDNTLVALQNSSYPTQPHSIIANYYRMISCWKKFLSCFRWMEVISCATQSSSRSRIFSRQISAVP